MKVSVLRQIPPTVWALGLVTLFMNGSTIVIFTVMPVYLTVVLDASMVHLGIIEGIVEASGWFMRVFSGVLSDYLQKRKPLLVFAYGVALCSRVLLPLVPSVLGVFTARFLDRLSNGIQATPREALISDVAPKNLKGACYGLRESLGRMGSFIAAFALIFFLQYTHNNYLLAFWIAAVPCAFAVFTIVFFVKDALLKDNLPKQTWRHLLSREEMSKLTPRYWRVLLVASIFMFANYSGAFMILQVRQAGLNESLLPLVMVMQNVMTMVSAFPVGWLSDYLGRRWLLSLGFVILVLANLALAYTANFVVVMVGVGLWGLQIGINYSLLVSKVADTSHKELRGTCFGIYYLVSAVSLILSNFISGWLSENFGLEYVFFLSAVVGVVALCTLPLIPKLEKSAQQV